MSNYLLPLIFGIVTSSFGIAIPGLINMTAAKVSLNDGRDRALLFVFGALFVIFCQSLIAVLFAHFIDSHPEVVIIFREVALAIFIFLTIYFLFLAKKPDPNNKELKSRSKTNRFFYGMLLSSFNFFPIPYYVFVTITLSHYNLFDFQLAPIFSYVAGVLLGSFLVFNYYITHFVKIDAKKDFFVNNINKIIGTITGVVSILTLINIINYYY
jgi:threonine/homoserine/homoserine lactone efflux protein